MKRITPFFLALAAMSFVAAKQENEQPPLKPRSGQRYVVLAERDAVAKLQRFNAQYGVNPAGHVTGIFLTSKDEGSPETSDLGFLRDLDRLEMLDLYEAKLSVAR